MENFIWNQILATIGHPAYIVIIVLVSFIIILLILTAIAKKSERKRLDDAEDWQMFKESHGACNCPGCDVKRKEKH